MKKSKGFTLIEIIAVMAMLAILAGIGTSSVATYMKIKDETINRTFIEEVRTLISIGKKIAVLEEEQVIVYIGNGDKYIYLEVGRVIKMKVKIPSNIRVISVERDIVIKSKGEIPKFVWQFKDRENNVYKIERPEGGDYIDVKEN